MKRFLVYIFLLLVINNGIIKAQSAEHWEDLFAQSYYAGFEHLPPLRQYWKGLSFKNNVTDLQPLSNGLDAILAMYETTDSVNYLDDAITISNNVINKAAVTKDISGDIFRFKDKYKGWIMEVGDTSSGIYHNETVLSEIYFFQYVARLLKDIHDRPYLLKQKEYQIFYKKTLAFIETDIWEKWESRGIRYGNRYFYLLLGRTHMASHWAYIAAELYFLTSNESSKSDYLKLVELYNYNLEKNFNKYGRYISWDQTWREGWNGKENSRTDAIVQDVSHANLIVSYIVEAYNLGLWKDKDAIQRLINTLKDKLWDPQDCLFRDNLDGTMFTNENEGSVGSFQADGFVKLTRFDSSLFPIYEQFISCSPLIKRWYQYGQLFANLALSRKLSQ